MIQSEELLSLASDIAYQAGDVLRSYYVPCPGTQASLVANTKRNSTDLVTQADIESERLILDAIRATFPDHAILSEESGESKAEGIGDPEYRWLVDPLDGTTNFAHGLPGFAVALALEKFGRLILSVTYDPLRDELFTAQVGRSACLNGQPIHVSSAPTLQKSLVSTGFAYIRATTDLNNLAEFSRVMPRVQGIRRLGSAALDMAYLACGRLDAYWEYHLSPWDWAGGALLVQEAGGAVTNMQGHPWRIGDTGLVASNGLIHDELLATLHGE